MYCFSNYGMYFLFFSVNLSSFHLFRSLSIAMRRVSFDTDAELRAWLDEFFESKPGDFYQRGI